MSLRSIEGRATPVQALSMRRRIERFPLDARRAWELGLGWPIPASMKAPRRVVVCGMGGSAIGGDFLRAYVRSAVPVEVVRDYTLPPCDEDTLLIACSYSGNTEETLAALQSEQARPAARLVVSTGGRIAELAPALGAELLCYDCEGPPRTAWQFGFLPALAVLTRFGVVEDCAGRVEAALDELGAASELRRQAAALAARLTDAIPFVVGAEMLAPVARRWASQANENAKRVAFFGELPEINHNFLLALNDSRIAAVKTVLLDAAPLSPRARERLDLTEAWLRQAAVPHVRVHVPGRDAFDAMLRGALLGDWLSWHMALADGADPMDTSGLERFKQRLNPAA